MASHTFVVSLLALAAVVQGTQQAAPPPQEPKATFKSSVDLVPVDVNVVDRDGRPLATLTAADFALSVDGKPRKIASAQFIAVTREVERAPLQPADYSSNASATGGRLIMLVVDQGDIGTARGKYALQAAGRFVSRLQKADRVGLTTIPGAGPQMDFTSNHAMVQKLLQTVVGQGDRTAPQDENIGITEAIQLQRGNEQLIQRIVERECFGFNAETDAFGTCRQRLLNEARRLYAETRSHTRDTLISLHHLVDRLSRTQTPKTIVLVSEGIMLERESTEVTWLAPLAARGQISLYILQLEPPHFDASGAQVSPSRAADVDFAQDGLAYLAGLARGTVFRVVSGAESAFTRLATELSGYYLLSFEPEPGDRDGKVHKIKIAVPGRKEATVRSRAEFSVDAARALSTQELLSDAIASPLMINDIGLKLATYSFTESESGKLRVVLAAEIDRTTDPGSKVSLAYIVTRPDGTIVSTQIEPEITTPVLRDTNVQTYLGAITVPPDEYSLKLAVVDDGGKRGSVEHRFRAQLTSAGQIHLTDLLLGDDAAGGGSVTPTASAEFTGAMLHGYVELQSDAIEPLKSASVALEVASSEQGRAIDSAPARFEEETTPSPNRRVAEGAVPIALLAPGEYVARAVVSVAGRRIGQVSRPFRIVRAGPISAAAGAATARPIGGGVTIPFSSRIEAFDRSSVLAPQVVGFFLDRMNTGRGGGVTPPAALEAARAGKFEEAIDAAKASGNSQLAPVFLGGLALYAKGDLEGAAGRFRESLRLDSEFFPAAFYLGACYAAGGKDREAAGAWQTSLITESDAPFIYTLLGDAFLRLHEVDQALDILREATSLWPGNEQVQLRLGTALADADKPVDAVRTLNSYLAQHPEDQQRLFIALRAIYQARSTGQSIGTPDEDRARFQRYAAAYAAAGGTQLAMVEQWKKFVLK